MSSAICPRCHLPLTSNPDRCSCGWARNRGVGITMTPRCGCGRKLVDGRCLECGVDPEEPTRQ